MQTELFTISKLFTERLLRIPDYQRGYAWTEKQLKEYWNDLLQIGADKSHYIGVLTLEEVPSEIVSTWTEDAWIIQAKNYAPFYVVDGQQRLTTTIILIQAIVEAMPNGKPLNFTSADEIRRKFLFDSKDQGVSRSYIFGYEKDNPSYEYLKTRIFCENSEISFQLQETSYTRNLEFSKSFFVDRLAELTFEELEIVFKKVTQCFLFNIYAISSDIDVFVAFETINNRGKPLSHLELLKNRLIYLSTKFNAEEYEKTSLRNAINESWKAIYHQLGRNKNRQLDDDTFLRNHFFTYFSHELAEESEASSLRIDRLYHRYRITYKEYLLEKYFTSKSASTEKKDGITELSISDVHSYAKSIKNSVELWYQILNPIDSDFSEPEKEWLDKINRIGMGNAAPLIMVFYEKSKDIELRLSLLRAIEQIKFLYLVLTGSRIYIESDAMSMLQLAVEVGVGNKEPSRAVREIQTQIDSIVNHKGLFKTNAGYFKTSGFYKWDGIKYFLYEYELSLKEKSRTSRFKLQWSDFIEDSKDYYTVEHIYPQRPRKPCWTELYAAYSTHERGKLRHSIGNLVPLSKAKNSSLSNKCFHEKVEPGAGTVGFKYGSYSEIEVSAEKEWTAANILDRGLRLLDFMEKRWGLKIGDKKSKINFLGLNFVTQKETKQRKQNITKQ